jgi:SPX domain protein involved in polyphosphate accumulation
MKYGKCLRKEQIPQFQRYYLDYKMLKRQLKGLTTADENLENASNQFMKAVHGELEKVNRFSTDKVSELRNTLLKSSETLFGRSVETLSVLSDLEERADEFGNDLVNVETFVMQNFTGFVKIMKKHDKKTGKMQSPWFLARLVREPFYKVHLDDVLIALSDMYSRIRALRSDSGSTAGTEWVAPDSFVRKTTKYWVRCEHVLLVKKIIVKHLPLLIYGRKEPGRPLSHSFAKPKEGHKKVISDSNLISSVYFDTDDLELYHQRLERADGATAIRFRWYGAHGHHDKEIFIERKIHHESWSNEQSVKERFGLFQRHCEDFIAGKIPRLPEELMIDPRTKQPKPEEALQKANELFGEVQGNIITMGLQPSIRTCYSRSAFQLPYSNKVRISLDTNIRMLNECLPKKEGHWCRGINDPLMECDVHNFPYAVLEMKLGDADAGPPEWINDLII